MRLSNNTARQNNARHTSVVRIRKGAVANGKVPTAYNGIRRIYAPEPSGTRSHFVPMKSGYNVTTGRHTVSVTGFEKDNEGDYSPTTRIYRS